MKKKLSVVIPTLNRKEYLENTIDLILPQVLRNSEQVELVICNNASKDSTDQFVKTLIEDYSFIKYFFFDEYVDICASIGRSILKTSGEYVLIFGDDDIPAPYYLETILEILSMKKNIGLINFNRLMGNDKNPSIINLSLLKKEYNYNLKELSLSDFLSLHAISPGFISSAVFLRSAWENGLTFHTQKHYGYDFLGIFYNGIRGMNCIHFDYPMLIQRQPYSRDWMNSFPLYRLIGVPNLMKDLDKWGLCKGALGIWEKTYNKSFFNYCYILFVASAYKKQYKPLCKEINNYQHNYLRKLMTYLFILLMPSGIYKWIRRIYYNS